MKKRSQRISSEEMAKIAHANPGSEIELEGGYAYLSLGSVEYVASLDAHAASLDPAVEAQTWPGSNGPRGRAS